ncbi:MAG: TOBE domain-containing protein [Terriglobales bacterium]
MTRKSPPRRLAEKHGELLKLREAALELRISFPTIKQWIYKRKIRSVKTAGGHHRIPQSEVDRLLYRTRAKTGPERDVLARRVSGRNQLVGRINSVRISGLMAEIKISIGDQEITSIITASSAREMNLKPGQTAAALIKATEVMILRVI